MNAKANDAIALLISEHREVNELFKQFEELGDRAKAKKKKIVDAVCTALTVHAQIEEEIFYPAVRASVKDADDLVDEAAVEHASAKDLIAQLKSMSPSDDLYDAKVAVLGEYIEHHVKQEETEMFVMVKNTKLDLQRLGQHSGSHDAA